MIDATDPTMDQAALHRKLLEIGLTLEGAEMDAAAEKLRLEFEEYSERVAACQRDREILAGWWDCAVTSARREIASRNASRKGVGIPV